MLISCNQIFQVASSSNPITIWAQLEQSNLLYGQMAQIFLMIPGLVTSVKDQGGCGSCSAFAATALHESCLIKAGSDRECLDLSEQYLMNCGLGNPWVQLFKIMSFMVKDVFPEKISIANDLNRSTQCEQKILREKTVDFLWIFLTRKYVPSAFFSSHCVGLNRAR